MEPKPFKFQNIVYAENQDQYQDMPAHNAPGGLVISCWKGTLMERLKFLFKNELWLNVRTFDAPLQPMSMQMKNPFNFVPDKTVQATDTAEKSE